MGSDPVEEFERLINTEDYLEFFAIPYEPRVIHVNRLHILKKFALLKDEVDRLHGVHETQARLAFYKEAMRIAYETFLTSTAPEERLFKVFQQPPPGLLQITISPGAPGVGPRR